jgi:Lon protease-like protein
MREEIALFPLQVVMFPGSKIPLHIFEERYKKLVSGSVTTGREFGIVLVLEGRLQPVGTSVMIDRIVRRFENGEMDIVVEGLRRFRIHSYEAGQDGLLIGKVEFLEDSNSEFDISEMKKAVDNYNLLVEIAYKGDVRFISQNDEKWSNGKRSLCFAMAEKCGLGLDERQRLLELDHEQDRLDYVSNYLENIIPKLREAERIAEIIKSDGYIQ